MTLKDIPHLQRKEPQKKPWWQKSENRAFMVILALGAASCLYIGGPAYLLDMILLYLKAIGWWFGTAAAIGILIFLLKAQKGR